MSIRNHASRHPPTARHTQNPEHPPTGCHTEKTVSTITPVPPAGPAMLTAGTGAGLTDHTLSVPRTARWASCSMTRGRAARSTSSTSRPGPAGSALAAVGSRRGHRRLRGPRHRRSVEPPGASRGPRPGGPERDHLHRRGFGQVARLPAAGLTSVLAGDTVLYVTPTKALAADQLASIRSLGLPGCAGGHVRRRLDLRGAGLGAQPRQVPADHAGHAAPRAAAGARAWSGFSAGCV